MRKRPELLTMMRSAPPAASNLAEMTVPAPALTMGTPRSMRLRSFGYDLAQPYRLLSDVVMMSRLDARGAAAVDASYLQ